MIQLQDAAVFQAASTSTAYSYEYTFPAGSADSAAFVLRTRPAVHAQTWRYVHANPVAFQGGNKGLMMLTRNNNDPMAMDAVGFSIFWRDSP